MNPEGQLVRQETDAIFSNSLSELEMRRPSMNQADNFKKLGDKTYSEHIHER